MMFWKRVLKSFQENKPLTIWLIALILCLLWNYSALLRFSEDRDQAYITGWDDNFYFAWARSLIVDHDVNFKNDFEFLANLRGFHSTQRSFSRFMSENPQTSKGYVSNKYGIGMAIISLPFMYIARGLVKVHEVLGGKEVIPFASIYCLAFIFTSIFSSFFGIIISYRILSHEFGKRCSLIAILSGVLALSLGYYIWFQPTMAHAVGFACCTLFVFVTLQWHRRFILMKGSSSLKLFLFYTVSMGALLGLNTMIRFTNGVFFLFPATLSVHSFIHERSLRKKMLRSIIGSLVISIMAFFIAFSPQMIAWKKIYGSFICYSYEGEKLHLFPRYALLVLFGMCNSLFIWTPFAIIAVVGLLWAAGKGHPLAISGCCVLLAFLWIYGAWESYTLGSSYGMRGFVDASFFFLFGISWIVHKSGDFIKPLTKTAWIVRNLFIILIAWNIFFVFSYRAMTQPHEKPFAGWNLIINSHKALSRLGRDLRYYFRLKKFPLFTPKSNSGGI